MGVYFTMKVLESRCERKRKGKERDDVYEII